VRQHHRDARADEQEGEAGGEVDAELGLARVVPPGARAAQDAVREEETAERQRVGAEEEPHSDLAHRRFAEVRVRFPSLVRISALVVMVVPVRDGDGVLRRCFLLGCGRCAHRLVFPWVLSRLRCPWLVREVSDGKGFLGPLRPPKGAKILR
jgi:hypothetical protein